MRNPGQFKLYFGQYKGRTIESVYKTDPTYVTEFLREQCEKFWDAVEAAQDFIKLENQRIIEEGRIHKARETARR